MKSRVRATFSAMTGGSILLGQVAAKTEEIEIACVPPAVSGTPD
jgi:hypothetical protein